MRTVFYMLSAKNEEALDRELAAWDQEPTELMRHVCRAYSFTKRRMFAEAADQYDAALVVAPESLDLLIKAIQAHRRTGNLLRVNDLKRRLPPNMEIPE